MIRDVLIVQEEFQTGKNHVLRALVIGYLKKWLSVNKLPDKMITNSLDFAIACFEMVLWIRVAERLELGNLVPKKFPPPPPENKQKTLQL